METRQVQSREEIAEVARLARGIWREHYVKIIGQAQVDYMLDKFQSENAIADQLAHGYEYYLAISDGQGAGYVAIVHDPDESTLMVSKIYVHKALRGRGYGKKMLEFAEQLSRERGATTMWLTVNRHNDNSVAWYERMGFVNAGPCVTDIGGGFVMDDFRMEKIL